jgi:hypothetical protein
MPGAVTSVSMSTRGHSHMRGLVPQDGLFGGSGAAGLKNERGLGGAAHSAFADSLLTLPSPLVINGRVLRGGAVVLAQRACSGNAAAVNVEHAQRSEHERR